MPALTQKIVQSDFELPRGETTESVLPFLFENLGSTNSEARNASLSVFNNWISKDVFSKDWLDGILLEKSLTGMRYKLGASGDESVFVRSYFALLLLELLHYNLETAIFDKPQLETIHAAVSEALLGEKDYRAVVPGKGWAYSIPHMCDNFWKLMQAKELEPKHHEATLQTIGKKLSMTGSHIFTQFEDERLAYVVRVTVEQNLIATDFFANWLTELTALPDNSYLAIVEFPGDKYTAYCNVRAFLRSLYFQLKFRDNPSADIDTFSSIVKTGLQRLDPGFYSTF